MALVTLTEVDNRSTIEACEGDEIAVRLRENPTTGYRWHLERATGSVEPAGDEFQLGPSPKVGSGGVREFRFRVHGTGPGRIELKHWQQWEGEASMTARFAVKIVPVP